MVYLLHTHNYLGSGMGAPQGSGGQRVVWWIIILDLFSGYQGLFLGQVWNGYVWLNGWTTGKP